MKIAILTQPLRANYGGVLQNYALQQVLINLGHSPTTIQKDFHQYISTIQLVISLPKRFIAKYILKKREHIFSEQKYNQLIDAQPQILQPFIDKNIKYQLITNFEDVNISDYDAFIVGSDQVWRPLYNWGVIDKMFLSFIPREAKTKRIAYAASFGTSEWEFSDEQTLLCHNLIKNFDAVSTREMDGVDLCKKHLNRDDVVNVLDPTLLLEKEDYTQICKNVPTNDDILFAYILDVTCDSKSILEKIAKEKGLKLKLISAHEDCTLSIEEWLAMFRDAKMVITDSFHGTVFSIILNTEFYSIINAKRGSSRFLSLLNQFNLQNRLSNSLTHIHEFESINWADVNSKLELLKSKSINFLLSSLENNNE